jgi:hypothetical protein
MEVQPKSPTAKGPAEWFNGDVWIDAIAEAAGSSAVSIGLRQGEGMQGDCQRSAEVPKDQREGYRTREHR